MFGKLLKKILLVSLILLLSFVLLIVGSIVYGAFFGLKYVDDDISQYEHYRQEQMYGKEFMPQLASLGEYQDIRFAYKDTTYSSFFIAETMNLFVQYSPEDYNAKKSAMLARDDLINEPVYSYNGELICYPCFEYAGYNLQAVALEKDGYYACKYVGYIGYDDTHHALCYLLYCDDDRDMISEAGKDPVEEMQRWMKQEFWFHKFK